MLAGALLGWWGVPLGLVAGAVGWWWFGRIAADRLAATGPELLALFRHGRVVGTTGPAALRARPQLTRRQQAAIMTAGVLGTLALFPQGLVPLIFQLTQNPTRAWFFALYLPAPWDLLTTVAMMILGLLLYGQATRTYTRSSRTGRV